MTDPNLESQDDAPETGAGPQHIEVAPPVASEEPPAVPAGPAGPRNLPQHFSLLFGCFCVLVGSMAVWERAHVFGATVEGDEKLAGAILFALAGYSTIIATLNVMQGRLRGMLAMFTTAFFALYFGIPALLDTYKADGFVTGEEIEQHQAARKADGTPPIPDRFLKPGSVPYPMAAIDKVPPSWQGPLRYIVGQYGPGPIMTTFGSALLIWVFLKGMFGGKKKSEPAPAPSRGRSRRR